MPVMHQCKQSLPEAGRPGERTTCAGCNVTYEWDAKREVWVWIP